MSGLLAADAVAVPDHVLVNVLVADLRLGIADPGLVKSLIKPEIGHDCSHDSVVEEFSSLLHILAVDVQDMVTGDDIALFIDTQAPVRISVISKSDVQMVVQDELPKVLDVGGAAVGIDVQAVRLIVDDIGLGAERIENALRDRPRRSVRDVEADALAVEAVF